ncbi:unnamed protein product [Phytomonas sp. Hart1]|nr:unnamed protein product [Phytomonas sp. Hart1]|eukprot:CCW67761.1 unnamed protein product [Phytomonas sp. isolate Hart1]
MSDLKKGNRFQANTSNQTELGSTRTLRIKLNVLHRTIKDLTFAKKEVEQETERLEKIRATEPDRVTQQENVLNEAKMMVPHSTNRIRTAAKDISDYIDKEKECINDEELLTQAKSVLIEAEKVLDDNL